ncbi:MAG TPA: hypothetical protein VLG12_03995 [Candidatus Saccharimonadales bacterium]|nr:hypothetical protein [Candidatus Saccharimonadales bacterium]
MLVESQNSVKYTHPPVDVDVQKPYVEVLMDDLLGAKLKAIQLLGLPTEAFRLSNGSMYCISFIALNPNELGESCNRLDITTFSSEPSVVDLTITYPNGEDFLSRFINASIKRSEEGLLISGDHQFDEGEIIGRESYFLSYSGEFTQI